MKTLWGITWQPPVSKALHSTQAGAERPTPLIGACRCRKVYFQHMKCTNTALFRKSKVLKNNSTLCAHETGYTTLSPPCEIIYTLSKNHRPVYMDQPPPSSLAPVNQRKNPEKCYLFMVRINVYQMGIHNIIQISNPPKPFLNALDH